MRSKQVIVIRRDLAMSTGKTVAQGAHASLLAFMEADPQAEATIDWTNGIHAKICVCVDSEEKLVGIHENAKAAGLPTALVTDHGLTEFDGVHTRTAVAIGPAWSDDIDPITKRLRLLA